MVNRQEKEFWEKQVLACEQTGQSLKAFCRQHGLAYSTFQRWRARLKGNPFVRIQLPYEEISLPKIVVTQEQENCLEKKLIQQELKIVFANQTSLSIVHHGEALNLGALIEVLKRP